MRVIERETRIRMRLFCWIFGHRWNASWKTGIRFCLHCNRMEDTWT